MPQGKYFLVNISAVKKPIQNNRDFVKLSFNFNFNLVESWDSFILYSSMPLNHSNTQPNFELVSEPPDILNKTAKIFARKYWPYHTKKIPEQRRPKQIT